MTSMQLERPVPTYPTFLVVGCGNELQGDRGIGPRVARTVASWHLPNVKSIVAHELVPELATSLAASDNAIFVNACAQLGRTQTVQLSPICLGIDRSALPDSSPHNHTPHNHSASALLALTQEIYSYAPQAWMLQTPAASFVSGQPLSPTAIQSCDRAIVIIERFLSNYAMAPAGPSAKSPNVLELEAQIKRLSAAARDVCQVEGASSRPCADAWDIVSGLEIELARARKPFPKATAPQSSARNVATYLHS